MALQKQTQSIPFTQGVDEKGDPKLSARPSRMENAVFRGGSVAKRWGRTQLTATTDASATLTTAEGLFTYGDELTRVTGGTAYGYAEATQRWVAKSGGGHYSTLSKTQLVRSTVSQLWPDWAHANGVVVLAWIERQGTNVGVHVRTYDEATGVCYQTGATALAGTSALTSFATRCVVLGDTIAIYFIAFGNMYWTSINTLSPSTAPAAPTAIRSDVYASTENFAAIAYNSGTAMLFYTAGATGTDVKGVIVTGTGGTVSSSATFAGVIGANGGTGGVIAQRATNGNVAVIFADATNFITRRLLLNSSLGNVVAVATIIANGTWSGAQADVASGTLIETSTNVLTGILSPFTNPYGFLQKITINATTGVTTNAELSVTPNLQVTGEAAAYDGTFVFGAVNLDLGDPSGAIQCTAWVIDINGNVVSRGLTGSSGYSSVISLRAANTFLSASGQLSFLFLEQGRISYSSLDAATGLSTPITALGLTSLGLTKTNASQLPATQVGKTTYVGGALPRIYDGTSIVDTGFPMFPAFSASDSGAGGLLSAGTYQWVLIYSWLNTKGELVRGIASPPVSLTLVANHKATLSVYPMPLSMKDLLPAGASVIIEVYRTQANGSVFNRQSSVTVPTLNATTYAGTTAGLIPILDNSSDLTISTGELLYTTGGILDWEPPPAHSAACAHKDRLIVCSAEDPYKWLPSSKWVPGEMVRFSAFTASYVPADTGPLVGCASMDGKLILFTTQAAYVVIGDGPDQLGNNLYPPPERIVSVDTGPLSAVSIIETPVGIMYQSNKGITLLGRDLNTTFIGADVEDYSTGAWVVRSAFVDSTNQQIRFQADSGSDVAGTQAGTLVPSNGGVCLVYDYFYNQWSVFTNYGALAIAKYKKNLVMAQSNGVVWQETPGLFLDVNSYVPSLVETNWIKVAGLQGYQRLFRTIVLGTYGADFTFQWEVAYSYAGTSPNVPTFSETVTLDGAGVFAQGGPFQVRHHMGVKCEAVKFRFTDTNLRGNGQGMALTDVSFEYGIKGGVFKLPTTQSM